ncbi:MAG: PDZ domain-containing protein [Anaerolineae bacterium]
MPSLLGKLGAVVSDTSLIPKNQVQGTLPKGVIIIGKIRPSSPAERASLLPGDIITEADGQPIDSHRAAKRVVERWKRGEDHTMTVLRGQQSLHIFVQM